MTNKERMLAALDGRPSDRMPWAPRLDLWYRANKRAGTLPARYRNASLTELVDDLGWGLHAVVPDFRDLSGGGDDTDRVLGVYNLGCMPCRTIFENVGKTVTVEGDRTRVEYATPYGTIRTVTLHDEAMRRAGITISYVEEHAFKTAADYRALGHIFENARVEPNYAGYRAFADSVGERGLAVAFVSLAGSPMHLVLRELMPFDLFYFETFDHPEELAGLKAAIDGYWRRLLAVAADAPAEVVFLGANYDATITPPPFFAEHILPTLRDFADMLHARGRRLITHTDGENSGLLGHYLDSRIDIADSVCPAPMTRLSFREVRDFFAGRVSIMGGVPSITLVPGSMPDGDFEPFLDGFFADAGRGDHLILGVSDTTPPGASFARLESVARRVEQFGSIRP